MRSTIITLAILISVAGCATTPPAPTPQPEQIEVQPSWRPWLIDTSKEMVLNRVATPSTLKFLGDPIIEAHYDPAKNVTLIEVFGSFDAQNTFGAMVRESYDARWLQHGRLGPDSTINPQLEMVLFVP